MVALSEFIEANTNIIQQQSRLSGYAFTTKITARRRRNRRRFGIGYLTAKGAKNAKQNFRGIPKGRMAYALGRRVGD